MALHGHRFAVSRVGVRAAAGALRARLPLGIQDRGRAGSPVWPLAVGVVLAPHPVNGHTLTEDRLALALGAYKMGHFLLDLIDVPAWAAADASSWAPVWTLVTRTRADAVIVHGGTSARRPRPPSDLRGLPIHLLTPDRR